MSIQVSADEKPDGTVVLSIKGEMDMNSSPNVRKVLTRYFSNEWKRIVVDLSGVPYMDSSGIATLVEGLQWSHSQKRKFRLAGLNNTVRDIFEIARLLQVFEVYDSLDAALETP